MDTIDFAVPGGTLTGLRFGAGPSAGGSRVDGARTVLAAHGIAASGMSFRAVARHLPPGWTLVALDLRGRGASGHLPGPYGMSAHATDIWAATEQLGGRVVLTGQSMGGYAALRAAAGRPDLFERLLLIDGGLPLPVPDEFDPDEVLAATLGPSLKRLDMTFPSFESYVDYYRAYPALREEWNEDMEAFARYDAAGEPPHIHSRVSRDAFAADGRDLLVNAASFGDDLRALAVPTLLLHAPLGMFGAEPALLPQPLVDHWVTHAPHLSAELVPDTNHYTILLTDGPAATIAERLTAAW